MGDFMEVMADDDFWAAIRATSRTFLAAALFFVIPCALDGPESAMLHFVSCTVAFSVTYTRYDFAAAFRTVLQRRRFALLRTQALSFHSTHHC